MSRWKNTVWKKFYLWKIHWAGHKLATEWEISTELQLFYRNFVLANDSFVFLFWSKMAWLKDPWEHFYIRSKADRSGILITVVFVFFTLKLRERDETFRLSWTEVCRVYQEYLFSYLPTSTNTNRTLDCPHNVDQCSVFVEFSLEILQNFFFCLLVFPFWNFCCASFSPDHLSLRPACKHLLCDFLAPAKQGKKPK